MHEKATSFPSQGKGPGNEVDEKGTPGMFRATSHTTLIIINYFAVSLQCSVSCGLGTRSREVTCKTLETKLVLPLGSCNLALKPKETEKCNPGPCTVTWLASNWSEVGFQDLLSLRVA